MSMVIQALVSAITLQFSFDIPLNTIEIGELGNFCSNAKPES